MVVVTAASGMSRGNGFAWYSKPGGSVRSVPASYQSRNGVLTPVRSSVGVASGRVTRPGADTRFLPMKWAVAVASLSFCASSRNSLPLNTVGAPSCRQIGTQENNPANERTEMGGFPVPAAYPQIGRPRRPG